MPGTCPIYDQDHKEVGSVELAAGIFGETPRMHVVHQVVKMFGANQRAGTTAVRNKGRVSGGGKKPWRQKGTGRARAGSIRSPLWKGGGTIFGPQPKEYWTRIPRKMRDEALRIALSSRAREEKIVLLTDLSIPDGKTKSFCALAGKMGWTGALIIGDKIEKTTERAVRNVPGYKVMEWKDINVVDVLKYPLLVMTKNALERLSARLS